MEAGRLRQKQGQPLSLLSTVPKQGLLLPQRPLVLSSTWSGGQSAAELDLLRASEASSFFSAVRRWGLVMLTTFPACFSLNCNSGCTCLCVFLVLVLLGA